LRERSSRGTDVTPGKIQMCFIEFYFDPWGENLAGRSIIFENKFFGIFGVLGGDASLNAPFQFFCSFWFIFFNITLM
jgi:hypothetical protein